MNKCLELFLPCCFCVALLFLSESAKILKLDEKRNNFQKQDANSVIYVRSNPSVNNFSPPRQIVECSVGDCRGKKQTLFAAK